MLCTGSITNTKRRCSPHQLKYFPRTIDICRFDCFAKLIEADLGVDHPPAAYWAFMNRLPELLSASLEVMKADLGDQMRGSIPRCAIYNARETTSAETLLNSVAATFECWASCQNRRNLGRYSAHTIMFGFDEVASHHCGDEQEGLRLTDANFRPPLKTGANFEFSTKASSCAISLAQCAGLDKHTTVAEMDTKDLRFICTQCQQFGLNSLFPVEFGWREAVSSLCLSILRPPCHVEDLKLTLTLNRSTMS